MRASNLRVEVAGVGINDYRINDAWECQKRQIMFNQNFGSTFVRYTCCPECCSETHFTQNWACLLAPSLLQPQRQMIPALLAQRLSLRRLNVPVTVCFSCGYAGMPIHDEELQLLKQARGE